ncbi:6-pyruvoyl trahydropterin synthase family protein [Pandoraea anhela]|uniref:6-carboxy-5,6,7,8-tetrahydropterin synthase n=1 Tax=Pandoraea anhela TaxID=2508295 RepID=A0A5E4SFV1_9BURK|nr:6-carboxytetrahydropterin synthase [Pandoraea anhela]VVD74003.1 6-carboxytetrahydropterin synthase [Pandoraea anhela]
MSRERAPKATGMRASHLSQALSEPRERSLNRTAPRRARTHASSGTRAQFTLSRSFVFEAAHTLNRRDIDLPSMDASRRIHGHSYRATVEVTGVPTGESGMVVDLGQLDVVLARVSQRLDHRLLDDVAGLGPATLENLCAFIWRALAPHLLGLSRVTVSRDLRGDACSLTMHAA